MPCHADSPPLAARPPPAGRARGGARPPPSLPWVQVLRAAAALAVVWLHVTQQAGALVGQPGAIPYAWLRPLPWDAGVDVFFVISGFVMVWSSAGLFGRADAPGVFLRRRVARVVPLYWLLTTLLVAGALVRPSLLSDGQAPGWREIAASYAFWPWRRPDGFIQPVFRLGWTLNYEMLFYAVFAVAVRARPAWGVPAVVGVMVALAGCGRVLRPAWAPLAFWTDPIVLEFAGGVLLGTAALGGVRLPRGARALLVVAALALLAADATRLGVPRGVAWGLPATLLVAAATLPDPRLREPVRTSPGWVAPALALGDASYALYLMHPFAMRLLARAWPSGFGLPVLSFIAAAVLASLLLSVLLHRLVERQLTQSARRLLRV